MGVHSVLQCGVHVPSYGPCWSVKSIQECRSSQCGRAACAAVCGSTIQRGVQSSWEYSLHGSTVCMGVLCRSAV